MKSLITVLFVLSLSTSDSLAWQDGQGKLDEASQMALHQTVQMLNSPELRKKAIDSNGPAATDLDQRIQGLTGGANGAYEDIYSLASDIFKDLAKGTDGSAGEMKKILGKAMKDPKAFGNSLSQEHKDRIRAIANDIERFKGKQD